MSNTAEGPLRLARSFLVSPRLELCISIAVLASLLAWGGCGGPDLVVGGSLPITATTTAGTETPTCFAAGEVCVTNSDCCSNSCIGSGDGITLVCE
jgi:hypothetical protein